MKTWMIGLVAASAMTLSACETMDSNSRTVAGVAGGAAAGLVASQILDLDNDWTTITALAGAAAGTVVAQNQSSGQCYYARGDGTYYKAAC